MQLPLGINRNRSRNIFKEDKRIKFICKDANEWLNTDQEEQFDLIFADAWPGKFSKLDEALSLVKIGGYYLIDDLLPQPNWPEDHPGNVAILLEILAQRDDFVQTTFNWSTGLILFTKINPVDQLKVPVCCCSGYACIV